MDANIQKMIYNLFFVIANLASLPRGSQYRPAPDDGQSIGWRLIFWILFYQEKSIIQPPAKAKIPIFAKYFS